VEPDRVFELVEQVEAYVTDSIWIGQMNRVAGGVVVTDELLAMMVERFDDHPKIKWKDSLSERIVEMVCT